MTDKKKTSASYSSLKGFHRAVPIILIAIAVFTFFCFVIKDMGLFGNAISGLFLGLFSYGAYAIPLLLCLHAVFYPADLEEKRITSRVIFSLVTVIAIASLAYAITYWNDELVFNGKAFFNDGKQSIGGGFIGSTVGFCLIKVFSKIGLVIIACATFAIYISYFFAKGQRKLTAALLLILKVIVVLIEMLADGIKSLFGKAKKARNEKKNRATEQKNIELTEDEFFGVDNGMQKLKIPELGIKETKTKETLENNPTLQEKVFHKSVVSPEEAEEMEEMEMRERAAELFAQEQAARMAREPESLTPKRRIVNVNYGDLNTDVGRSSDKQDIIIEEAPEKSAVPDPIPTPSFSADESADAIFTRDFDPFSMIMSEELASKPSSKSLLDDAPVTRPVTVKEDISEMTEEDIERLKRIEDFEKRKAALLSSRKAVPVENYGEFTGTKKSIEFREYTPKSFEDVSEDDTAVSIKSEKSAELPKAEPARYTSIGDGDGFAPFADFSNQSAFTAPETIYFHEEPAEIVYERSAPALVFSSAEEDEAPSYTEEPAVTFFKPSEPEAPIHTEEPEIPLYRTPEPKVPVYEAPAPVAEPAPVYQQSAPAYAAPIAPVYEAPAPVAEPAPVYQQSAPAYTAPIAPVYEAPAPVAEPAPVYQQSAPAYTAPVAPVYEAPAPAAEPLPTEDNPARIITDNGYINTDTASNGESADYVPEFKPYQPTVSIEANDESVPYEETEEAPSTLQIERTFINDNDDTVITDSIEENEAEAESYLPEDADEAGLEDEEPICSDEDMAEEDCSFNTEEIPPEERNPVVQGYKDMFPALRDEEPEEEEDHPSDYQLVSPDEITDDNVSNGYDEEDDDIPPFEVSRPSVREDVAQKAKPEPKKEEKKKPDYSNYKMPSIDLLGLDPMVDDDNSEITENTNILIDTLASFNVTASIKGVDRGPRITRYEVVPARGVKVQAITSLYNDITLNLAKEGVRMEAPIPGKSAVGFEIPNKAPKNVRLRELLECEEFTHAKSKTFVSIGKDVAGNPVFGDISKYPHALICGATGMGKSVCINSILVSMLYKARPDEVKFIMIDPKKVEFKIYSGIPHLLIPVITESKQAAGALMWAVEEMERRYELIEQNFVRNIEAYNEKVTFDPSLGTPLPKIVIVIDELADLMMQVRDPVEDLIMRIAQKARAAGIHLIIGTQRPSVQVITGAIKANIPSRISCKVTSQVDSRTIFDVGGAEKLLNRGDMLYWPVDRTAPLRVQGAFVSDSEVEAIMSFLKAEGDGNQYDDEVMAEINKAAQKCGNNKKGGVSADDIEDDDQECGYYSDQQFLDAVDLAIRSKKISTSLLQRKLSIGYGKAAKYIDAMEEIGVVSEPRGQKPRDVLITMDEWHEKLARVDLD